LSFTRSIMGRVVSPGTFASLRPLARPLITLIGSPRHFAATVTPKLGCLGSHSGRLTVPRSRPPVAGATLRPAPTCPLTTCRDQAPFLQGPQCGAGPVHICLAASASWENHRDSAYPTALQSCHQSA